MKTYQKSFTADHLFPRMVACAGPGAPPSVDSDFRFIKAILKAAKKTRVSPATVNRKTHSAYLFYRVMFAKQGEIEGIGVYPNWGYDVDKYGADYESAQRYGGRVYYTHCFISPLVLSTVKIGADGQITGGVSFSGGDSKFEKSHCARRIIKNIVGASYIPGRYDGKLVETTHVYAWGVGFIADRYESVIEINPN